LPKREKGSDFQRSVGDEKQLKAKEEGDSNEKKEWHRKTLRKRNQDAKRRPLSRN